MLDEEQVRADCFLSIALDKEVYELTEADYNMKLPIKLLNENTKLTNCSPGVWKFTGNLQF
jgi:hypothetical protein